MPKNKRESLIFTVLMCAFMVYCMSIYNISLHSGFSRETFVQAWIGFPPAYIVGMLLDWFIVSKVAKKLAFIVVKPESQDLFKVIAISSCMVCGMVIFMSMYGAIEVAGISNAVWSVWLRNIPLNFIMALPLQLLVAGPIVRTVFRKVFPEGAVS